MDDMAKIEIRAALEAAVIRSLGYNPFDESQQDLNMAFVQEELGRTNYKLFQRLFSIDKNVRVFVGENDIEIVTPREVAA